MVKEINLCIKMVLDTPLILVGSGGSALYGLPIMKDLGNHLY